ncbi:MAG: sigma-54 dependent transcriptional regulator [Polyangiaceae bacterium]
MPTSLGLDILIVEDEPDILELLSEALETRGHRITPIDDGAKAMSCLDRRRFDVAICDVRLPNVDGMRIFRRIRRESPSSQVILMSAYGSVAEAVSAMQEDATHYLAKPFETAVLLRLVDRIAEQRELETALADTDPSCAASVLIGESPSMVRLRELITNIGPTDASVVLTGESGTGKELVAREIHRLSRRADRPLVAINCAAFPDTLLEAELFGHERGAFTGAQGRREGRFYSADGGTLFLDELGEMPLPAQVKLLRVLEEGRYQRLGSNESVAVDVRLVSATNVDVKEAVQQGKLREDIYHRLKVFQLQVPPLRERLADLPLLLRHFHALLRGEEAGPLRVSPRAWAALRHYRYPGNVRELKHILEHALVLSGSEEIDLCHLPEELRGESPSLERSPMPSLAEAASEFEREYLLRALRRCEWHKSKTAEMLDISRKTLWHKLKLYDIDGP